LHIDNPADTYLDTRSFAKGFAWVNGRPLGRVWSIGPQVSLYLPGSWLHKGENEVVVFDLASNAEKHEVRGSDKPLLDVTTGK
jgi:beta-galactosidase